MEKGEREREMEWDGMGLGLEWGPCTVYEMI